VFRGKGITISCTDRDRSAAFYQKVLGAVPLPGDGFGCGWYRLGELVFSIMPNAEASTPGLFPRDAMAMLWLEVDDLAAARRRLADAGVQIIDAPADGPYLLIADPDGLMIEVWERDEDPLDG
jgi:catechol 2,3-dioxygenase-like lactoylglutathione lyase family enzyme